jgi:hypothetical protein
MSTRLVTKADIEAAYDCVMLKSVREFNLEGFVVPSMVGFALGEKPGTLLPDEVRMPESLLKQMFDEPEHIRQHMVRSMVGELLHEGSTLRENLPSFGMPLPSLVTVACEGWVAESDDDIREQARKYGGVKNIPGRTECIMFFVHTIAGTFFGHSPIKGKPKHAIPHGLMPGQFDGNGMIEGPMTTGPLEKFSDSDSWSVIRKRETP